MVGEIKVAKVLENMYVTQAFGVGDYSLWHLKGHAGIDFRAYVGTKVFAQVDGVAKCMEQRGANGHYSGFGKYIRIEAGFVLVLRDGYVAKRIILLDNYDGPSIAVSKQFIIGKLFVYTAHLSDFGVKNMTMVRAGDLIGFSGNTGNSELPHLHNEWRIIGFEGDYGSAFDPTEIIAA